MSRIEKAVSDQAARVLLDAELDKVSGGLHDVEQVAHCSGDLASQHAIIIQVLPPARA